MWTKFYSKPNSCLGTGWENKNLKFGDGDGPNQSRVKEVNVSSTIIENIFWSGFTLVSSWDCFCHKD